jgi:alpha-tubulin suppressor-like RCC1 family protein
VPVDALSDVAQMTTGSHHTCARTRGGSLWCWGTNDAGQLGHGSTIDRLLPAPVSIGPVLELATGAVSGHQCARKADGSVLCWGSNARGQLGDGTTVDRSTPVVTRL